MTEFLVILELKGKSTEMLKGHIVQKRIRANDVDEAVRLATKGRIFEEEGFEVVAVETLYF